MNRLPNFLIVGVPKAGTTSLYYWLNQHPDIYMSPIKEPHYFSQIGNYDHITKWEEYVKLFKKYKNEKAIGEASTSYFHFYKKSIPLIKEKLGDVKIIVVLRNPIERAWSHYLSYKKLGREKGTPEQVFNQSYTVNEPWRVNNPYIQFSFYVKPLEAFLKNFKEVKIMLYDDLKNNPESFIKEIYEFLEVDSSFIPEFEIRNVSGIPRNKIIAYLLSLDLTNRLIPKIPFFIKKHLRNFLLKKEEIPNNIKKDLKELFKKDIEELSILINKDLKEWLR